MAQAQQLARSGRPREAMALIGRAADEGDPEALFTTANWRLFGLYGPRDLHAAHQLLGRAAENGHAEAARLRATLIGNGTGVPSDPERARTLLEGAAADPDAARQLALLPRMLRQAEAATRPVESMSDQPDVRLVKGLLIETECAYIRDKAAPALQPSFVMDPRTKASIPDPLRTSTGTNFGPADEDLVIHRINLRIAAASGTDVRCGEPLHVLRYLPGQQYRPHLDALPGAANQREWTVLIYLNEDYTDGETEFAEIGLRVRGRTGDALIFRNVGPDGRADPRSRHAGRPVGAGAKWLATRWIRAAPHSPWDA